MVSSRHQLFEKHHFYYTDLVRAAVMIIRKLMPPSLPPTLTPSDAFQSCALHVPDREGLISA